MFERLAATQSTPVDRPREDTNRVVQVDDTLRDGLFLCHRKLTVWWRGHLKETSCHNLPQELEWRLYSGFASIDSKGHGGVAQVVRAWDS